MGEQKWYASDYFFHAIRKIFFRTNFYAGRFESILKRYETDYCFHQKRRGQWWMNLLRKKEIKFGHLSHQI